MGLAPTTITTANGGGTFRGLYNIANTEGYTGLFRSSSIAWVPGGARMLYFTVYEHVADILGSNDNILHHRIVRFAASPSTHHEAVEDSRTTIKQQTTATTYPGWVYGTAGGISTFASQLIMAPYSVISSRLQIATGPTRLSAVAVLRDVVSRPNGVRALWTGYSSAIAQLGPQHATMWAVSAWLQNQLIVLVSCEDDNDAKSERNEQSLRISSSSMGSNIGLLPRLGTSMCGSFIAIVVTSPIDAVRTHRQIMISHPTQSTTSSINAASGIGSFSGGGGLITVPSSWSTFVLLYRQQGLRAFTNGIISRALANCPGMIAMMVGYQYVKQFAEYVQRQQQQQQQHND